MGYVWRTTHGGSWMGRSAFAMVVIVMNECRNSQECLDKAAECASRAEIAIDQHDREFYLMLEGLWRSVADSRRWTEMRDTVLGGESHEGGAAH